MKSVGLCAIVAVYDLWLHVNPTTVALSLLLLVLVLAARGLTTLSYDYFIPNQVRKPAGKDGRQRRGHERNRNAGERTTLQRLRFQRHRRQSVLLRQRFPDKPRAAAGPGVKPSQPLTGHKGAFPSNVAFKPETFAYPLVSPGQDGVPPCGPTTAGTTVCDSFESGFANGGRNIFRGAFQKRADISIIKLTQLGEGRQLRLSADFFNITNTPSFDTPGNNFEGDPNFTPYNFDNNGNVIGFVPLSGSAFTSQGAGVITNPLGSPRQIQFAGRISF